jgi:hypothetical protein
MQNLTPEGQRIVADVANRHGVSIGAALALLDALVKGNGYQAQFNHPDLGGMGQWSQGGMIMIGDMFNQGLKHRVDTLCNELAGLLHRQTQSADAQLFQSAIQSDDGISLFVAGSGSPSQWWPRELGRPSSTGAQNDLRYAFFPDRRRLALQQGGVVSVYDTGEHRLTGFAQQQGADESLTFTSQLGLVHAADLPLVTRPCDQPREPTPSVSSSPMPQYLSPPEVVGAPLDTATPPAWRATGDILKAIEALAELRRKGVLTEVEFVSKKTELLSRL